MKIENEEQYNNTIKRINYLLFRKNEIGLENDEADELNDLILSESKYVIELRNPIQVQKSESKFYQFFENVKRLWKTIFS